MRHRIEMEDAKAFVARSTIGSCTSNTQRKRLEVVVQDGAVFYAVVDHGETVLRVGNIEEAVNVYNELGD